MHGHFTLQVELGELDPDELYDHIDLDMAFTYVHACIDLGCDMTRLPKKIGSVDQAVRSWLLRLPRACDVAPIALS